VVERYRTDAVARRTIVQLVEAAGSLDVRSRVEVPAPIAARLVSVAVQPRQHVDKGQVLAILDERAVELALRSARVTVEAASGRVGQAQAGADEARRNLERARQLQAKGLATTENVANAQAALELATAAIVAARAERKLASETVAAAELGKSLAAIVAPVAGVVLVAPDRIGAAVSPDRGPLFVIGEPLDVMRVEAPVNESEIALIAIGSKAEVFVQALPNKTWSARVERIGIEPKRDGGVVLYPVSLLVDNQNGVLLPGMSVRVRVEVARAVDVLAVHEAALRFTPEDAEPAPARSRVWLKHRGAAQVESVAVKTGISDGVYAVVESGLNNGDAVAIGLLQPDQQTGTPKMSLGGKQ
jgi:HlyD family secretion protein